MKVCYFPGCTLKNKAKVLDLYARACAEALGVIMEFAGMLLRYIGRCAKQLSASASSTTGSRRLRRKAPSASMVRLSVPKPGPMPTACDFLWGAICVTTQSSESVSIIASGTAICNGKYAHPGV